MKSIPGPAYMVIGLFVTLASLIIDKVKLLPFAIVGAVLVMIGIVKVIAAPKKEKPKVQKVMQRPLQFRKCQYCGYVARPTDRYCGACSLPLGGMR